MGIIIRKLANGMTLILKNENTQTVTINVSVNVGSNDEPLAINGISHFLEHMVFEGTTKRDANTIANEIEKLGGEFNAVTSNEMTCYYIKVYHKHFEIACEILADMMSHPLIQNKTFLKEKKVVMEEIDMINDDAKELKWMLFYENIFEKHPARNPVCGTKKILQKMTRQQMVDFYRKYYVASNMTVAVVGNFDDRDVSVLEKKFSDVSTKEKPERVLVPEPLETKPVSTEVKKDIQQSYLVSGVKTVPRSHPDSFVLDVIKSILARGQSGRLFYEIRTKRGLVYDVGAMHAPSRDYGVFAFYVSMQFKNIPKAKKLIDIEVKKLLSVSATDLEDAKTNIEGEFLVQQEDTKVMAYNLSFWHSVADIAEWKDYLGSIKSVTSADIKRVVEKYLLKKQCSVLLKPK